MRGAEQQVRADDQPPARGDRKQGTDREREEPAREEKPAPPDPIGQPSRGEVRARLREPERSDEGEHRGRRADAELVIPDEGKDASLETRERADDTVERDEQCELATVGAETETDRARHTGICVRPARFAATISDW